MTKKINPNLSLFKAPLELKIKGQNLKTNEWTTSWIEKKEGERCLEIQCLFLKDPSKPARRVEIVLSEKDVAKLFSVCTEFLNETAKRAKKAAEQGSS